MGRIVRVVIPEYLYHVTQRGNYRQEVFEREEDYEKYLEWFKNYCEK